MSAKLFVFKHLPDKITCVADFVNRVTEWKQEVDTQVWFRGQPEIYKKNLIPTSGRQHVYNGKKVEGFDSDQERKLLDRFRRRSYAHLNRILTEWEALFLSRHHRLPTRILDWTANALVGLWFATSDKIEKRGSVWAIARVKEDKYDLPIIDLLNDPKSSPFTYPCRVDPDPDVDTDDAIKIVHPIYNSPRIVSQSGVFTFHSEPSRELECYNSHRFRVERLDIEQLVRWDIEPDAKTSIVQNLDGLGINQRTVYPDLDGLAGGLLQSEVLWRGTAIT